MSIDDDHLYHGAALIQIAEEPRFTAINAFKIKKKTYRSVYRVNDDVAVYLKYASKPSKPYSEYVFTFKSEHLADLVAISKAAEATFITLVCVEDRIICCLSYTEFMRLRTVREQAFGGPENQLTILVTVPAGKKLRVYVNSPGKKNSTLGTLLVSRNAFPGAVFE